MNFLGSRSMAGALVLLSVGFAMPGVAQTPASGPAARPAEVKVHDTVVFKLTRERKQLTAEQRAGAASRALEQALEQPEGPVRVAVQNEGRAIFASDVPIVELYAE